MGNCLAKKKVETPNAPVQENRTAKKQIDEPVSLIANNNQYFSVKGEDVDQMLYQAETSKKKRPNSQQKKEQNVPHKLSFLNERVDGVFSFEDEEEKNPLKTNLSVNGVEIFLIEDGNNKLISDGRLSSMGAEIFKSRGQKST